MYLHCQGLRQALLVFFSVYRCAIVTTLVHGVEFRQAARCRLLHVARSGEYVGLAFHTARRPQRGAICIPIEWRDVNWNIPKLKASFETPSLLSG